MRESFLYVIGSALLSASLASAQPQNFFSGTDATGQLALVRTVNLLQQAQNDLTLISAQSTGSFGASALSSDRRSGGLTDVELPNSAFNQLHVEAERRPANRRASTLSRTPLSSRLQLGMSPNALGIPVTSSTSSFGFMGLTHYDQRNANRGNQFSVEPPNIGIAAANGYVLEGVNNAVQVYNTSGTPMLPVVLASNEVFGVSAAINRSTGANGVYPTDMRVFYDQTLNRFFIMQRSQDNDIYGNELASSHLYVAISQTGDPTGTYNIYVMDTSNPQNSGCPCIADYPEIGADQYGVYLTWNEYTAAFHFRDAIILAVSKAALAANTTTPTAIKFTIQNNSGYEFAIYPAMTPPGGSYFQASGGLQYFVSSKITFASDSNVALWALANTSSLQTTTPAVFLLQTTVPTLAYSFPDPANQRPGSSASRPLGTSLSAPLSFIDGGDTRVLSVEYVGGRLYVTLPTQILDDNNRSRVGVAYMVISPAYRGGVLSGSALRQGYVYVNNNHLLRPSFVVNAQGKGAIVFTLVGPDYYPSAAFVTFESFAPGATVQIAGAGAGPEDGFSAYFGDLPIARWGDYSAAAVSSDGSVWMAAEYIPNAPRTELANWGTYLIRYAP